MAGHRQRANQDLAIFQKKTGSRNNTIAESNDGFVVELLIWNGNDSGILYREGSKAIYFDAIYPRDVSKEQTETPWISKVRNRIETVFRRGLELPPPIDVYVPDHLQWGSGIAGDKTEMSNEERDRILNNFERALDFLELPFHFVSDRRRQRIKPFRTPDGCFRQNTNKQL